MKLKIRIDETKIIIMNTLMMYNKTMFFKKGDRRSI